MPVIETDTAESELKSEGGFAVTFALVDVASEISAQLVAASDALKLLGVIVCD